MGGIFLAHFGPVEHGLNATVYLSIVADHVHPFITTVSPSSDATSSRIMHQSSNHLKHDDEFTLLKRPPQSPDLNPIEQLWDVVEREIHIMDLQQLCDAIISIWTKISEGCFQTLLNLCQKN